MDVSITLLIYHIFKVQVSQLNPLQNRKTAKLPIALQMLQSQCYMLLLVTICEHSWNQLGMLSQASHDCGHNAFDFHLYQQFPHFCNIFGG
jgi:hypothetical protein